MRLFQPKKRTDFTRDTRDFVIGFPEAEAEIGNSRIDLNAVYEDFLGIEAELGRGKFIVSGRKGSGKTATAERLGELARQDTNTYATFIKSIDKAYQNSLIGEHASARSLFEWIILSNLAETVSRDSTIIERIKQGQNLMRFVNANRNRINLDGFTLGEINENKSFNVNVTHLKRLSSSYKSTVAFTKHQAPFHRVIPQLKDLLVEILVEAKLIKDNNYVIVFDDLDIGVSFRDPESLAALADLVRLARDYNQDVFARNQIECRIILLLRRDISNVIRTNYADTAKIFSSYGVDINWFEEVGIRSATKTKN